MKKYSWKVKVKLLLIGMAAFALIIYNLAIKKTLNERRITMEIERNQVDNVSLESEIYALRKLLNKEEVVAKTYYGPYTEAEFMVSLAMDKDVIARKLPDQTIIEHQDREVVFQAYYFSGSFFNLLQLLDSAEHREGLNLLTAEFYKDVNPITRNPELIMKMETAKVGNRISK